MFITRLCMVLLLVGIVVSLPHEALSQKKMKSGKVLWAADDIKWDSLKGAPPGSGVMGSTLWGNPEKGPFGMFVKFPAGFNMPLHYHSNTLKAVVIKGAYIYVSPTGEEKPLGPGSYFVEPAMDHHGTKGAADSETIFYVESSGKFDAVPIEEKK